MHANNRSVVVGLALLLRAVSAFPQDGVPAIDRASQSFAVLTFNPFNCSANRSETSAQGACKLQVVDLDAQELPVVLGNKPIEDSRGQQSDERSRGTKSADLNRDIYYKNRLEFSLDGGWLPINIPFPFDVFEGDAYDTYPLKYTLVPIIVSLRWQMDDVGGPRILRGNWDLSVSGSAVAIPRGPETRYFAYIMGIRRNFVPRNSRIAPYWDVRLGLGDIDAKGPAGVPYAQGQDFTFTLNMGSGVRYNFNSRYAISVGLNYMHLSNANLSEHPYTPTPPNWGFRNYGINVYGPMVGIDVQLRRHQRPSAQ